jgi:hypothetical protein
MQQSDSVKNISDFASSKRPGTFSHDDPLTLLFDEDVELFAQRVGLDYFKFSSPKSERLPTNLNNSIAVSI